MFASRCGQLVAISALLLSACSTSDPGQSSSSQPSADQFQEFLWTDKAYFVSMKDMFDAAELVVVGEVAEVERGEQMDFGDPEVEDAYLQMAEYKIAVEQVIAGPENPPEEVTVVREGWYATEGTERRVSMDGVGPNEVGDRVLWFLEASDGRAGKWEHVSLDGLLMLERGKVATALDRPGGVAQSMNGAPIDQVLEALAKCHEDEPCGGQWTVTAQPGIDEPEG